MNFKVKFAKNGSNVTSAAVKLARAYTGKKFIACISEQPFFSFDDWFIGTTAVNRGIPDEHANFTLKFNFNDIDSLKKLFDKYPNQIAGVIMEPATSMLNPIAASSLQNKFREPDNFSKIEKENNFLHQVKKLCHANGSVFILDEMITGFRWHLQGAQKLYDVIPDLATFGKGMANGFSVAALAGKKEIMALGGINTEGMERTFSISTTHGAEMCGLGAFLKTVDIYKKEPVIDAIWKFGEQLIDGMNDLSKKHGISEQFYFEGFPCSPQYTCKDKNGNISLEFRTLFSQEMIKNNVLIPWVSICQAHSNDELEITLQAADKALNTYSRALNEGFEKFLKGRSIKPVFRKYN